MSQLAAHWSLKGNDSFVSLFPKTMFVNSDVSYMYLFSYKAYTAPTVRCKIFDRTGNITSFSSPVFLDRIRNTNIVAGSEEGT